MNVSSREPIDSENKPERSDEKPVYARVHVWQIQALRDVLFVAAVIGVVWVGHALRAVTVPLLVALLLAYLFEPLIERLCRHPKISRPLAVGAFLATGGAVVLVVLGLVLVLLYSQTTQFVEDVRGGVFRKRIALLEPHVPEGYRDDFRTVLDFLPLGEDSRVGDGTPMYDESNAKPAAEVESSVTPGAFTEQRAAELIDERLAVEMQRLREELAAPNVATDQEQATDWLNIGKRAVNAIFRIIGAIVEFGLVAFLIPFYFFFFSLWYPSVDKFGRDLLPTKNRTRTLNLVAKMDRVVAGFVRGRIVICLIMGGLLAAGWWICGVPYAILLGLVVGVFCAVPYLGVIGIPLAVGLLLFDQLGLKEAERMVWWGIILWPTLVFVAVQLIEAYSLTPLIAGKVTNLDPVTIIVAVLAGGSVLGIYGMLLAIPLAACGKILFTEVLLPTIFAWTRGEIADPLPIERE